MAHLDPWRCSQLDAILRRLGWQEPAIEALQCALWCVRDNGSAAEDLVGSFIAYACEYHLRKVNEERRHHQRHALIDAAYAATGGPQHDPGDVPGQEKLF